MTRLRAVPCALALLFLAACGGTDNGTGTGGSPASPSAVAVTVSPAPGATGRCTTPPTNPFVSGVAKVGPDDFNDTGNGILQVTDDCLGYIDLKVGTGAAVAAGAHVSVQYTGWLTNGTKFDSSRDRGQPFAFLIGQGQVIKGWDLGVATMKVGGRRKLIIPPALGYGAAGAGGAIPPNSTLVFVVEVLSQG